MGRLIKNCVNKQKNVAYRISNNIFPFINEHDYMTLIKKITDTRSKALVCDNCV